MRNLKQQKKPSIKEQTLIKKIITERENGTKRVQLDFSETVSRCKPEFAKETNINNIVKLPLPEAPVLSYGDLRDPPNLGDVFETIHQVKEHFAQLPSDIRKLMDNDPAKLQDFLNDTKNHDILEARGLLKKKASPQEPSNPPVASPKDSKVPKKTPDDKNA